MKGKNIFFDTSFNYKNQNKILKLTKKYNFKYIIKISLGKKYKGKLLKMFTALKNKHNINFFYAILLHNPNILKTKEGIAFYKELYELKKNKIAKKIGISTYGSENLRLLQSNKIKCDIIQTNANILDNNFFNFVKKYRKIMCKEIHIRSIFLQGILLQNKLPSKFKKFSVVFEKVKNFCKKNKIKILDLLISHIYKKNVGGIVFGINNKKEIADILNSIKRIKRSKESKFMMNNINSSLIDPRKW